MSAMKMAAAPKAKSPDRIASLLRYKGSCPIELTGSDNGLYERHLAFDNVVKLSAADSRERFEAFARSAAPAGRRRLRGSAGRVCQDWC
jgi:starch phosphorylase